MSRLSEKQKRFCEEYLIDLNATQAGIRAGYSPNGINKRVTRMMANGGVAQYIQQLLKERSHRTGITADTVIKELLKIALADTEITGREKMKALELLGKHLGIFNGGSNEENQKVLEKLDEVLGGIKSEF